MTPDFNLMLNLMVCELDALNPGHSFTGSEVFIRNYDLANKIYLYLEPLIESFLQAVGGPSPLQAAGINREMINFPHRLLKKPSLKSLNQTQQEQTTFIISSCFSLGLLYHLFYFNYNSQRQVYQVKLDLLADEWLPKTTAASAILHNYYKKENQRSARLLFEHYFNHSVTATLKLLGVAFWRRGKAHSFLLNLYLAGALLGMEFDLQIEK